jgi:hypothetical protein
MNSRLQCHEQIPLLSNYLSVSLRLVADQMQGLSGNLELLFEPSWSQ